MSLLYSQITVYQRSSEQHCRCWIVRCADHLMQWRHGHTRWHWRYPAMQRHCQATSDVTILDS